MTAAPTVSVCGGVFVADLMFDQPDWQDEVLNLPDLVSRILSAISEFLDIEPGTISLVFTSDAVIHKLNRQYRHKNQPTNVLSFATSDLTSDVFIQIEEKHKDYGDVIIALETMQRESGEQGKPLMNHTAHLVTHGVLHLLGFDHIEDDEAQEMEDLEREVLDKLDIADPYTDQ